MSRFYEAGPLEQVAINLFYGWGYNFYRQENQLRADDQLIRAHGCALLAQARAAVEAAESSYRRTHLPPPTRVQPLPDPLAVAGAQALERLSRALGGVEGQLRHQPVPENDRMTQRYRQEAATLAALGEMDKLLIGQAELLRQMLDGATGEAVLAEQGNAEAGIAAITETLRRRHSLLFSEA